MNLFLQVKEIFKELIFLIYVNSLSWATKQLCKKIITHHKGPLLFTYSRLSQWIWSLALDVENMGQAKSTK